MPATETQHHRLLASGLPAEEKRIRAEFVPSLLLILAVGLIVDLLLGISHHYTLKSTLVFGAFSAAYVGFLAVWLPRRMTRRLRQCWETYHLEMGNDYLTRRQRNLTDLSVRFDEIKRIVHVPGRYIRVTGTAGHKVIEIPECIEGFDEICRELSGFGPIEISRTEQWQKSMAFVALQFFVFIMMLWSTSLRTVISLGLIVIVMVIWGVVWSQRNPNLSRKKKLLAWPYLFVWLALCGLKLLTTTAPYLPRGN